jgi:light-regulated signal transduction histidine kinase (bacteriophytochrome)
VTHLGLQQLPIDLTSWHREQIQIPGTILPHAVMLVVDPNTLVTLQAGGDARWIFGVAADDLLGRALSVLFTPDRPIREHSEHRVKQMPRPQQ